MNKRSWGHVRPWELDIIPTLAIFINLNCAFVACCRSLQVWPWLMQSHRGSNGWIIDQLCSTLYWGFMVVFTYRCTFTQVKALP